jgi:hypothetical protein
MSKTSTAVKTIDRASRSGYHVDEVSANTVLLTRPVSPDVIKMTKVILAGRISVRSNSKNKK